MMNQPALFDVETTPAPTANTNCGTVTGYRYGCRCDRCKTAKRNSGKPGYRETPPLDRPRVCKQCGTHYTRRELPGSGTAYCSPDCRVAYYGPRPDTTPRPEPMRCGGCGATHQPNKRSTRAYQWNLCPQCLTLTEPNHTQFGNHAVPPAIIHAFIRNPTCPGCGDDITGRVKVANGRWRAAAVVDHDHRCCPRDTSCGQCVRGIMCRECNKLIPDRPDLTNILTNILTYLARGRP